MRKIEQWNLPGFWIGSLLVLSFGRSFCLREDVRDWFSSEYLDSFKSIPLDIKADRDVRGPYLLIQGIRYDPRRDDFRKPLLDYILGLYHEIKRLRDPELLQKAKRKLWELFNIDDLDFIVEDNILTPEEIKTLQEESDDGVRVPGASSVNSILFSHCKENKTCLATVAAAAASLAGSTGGSVVVSVVQKEQMVNYFLVFLLCFIVFVLVVLLICGLFFLIANRRRKSEYQPVSQEEQEENPNQKKSSSSLGLSRCSLFTFLDTKCPRYNQGLVFSDIAEKESLESAPKEPTKKKSLLSRISDKILPDSLRSTSKESSQNIEKPGPNGDGLVHKSSPGPLNNSNLSLSSQSSMRVGNASEGSFTPPHKKLTVSDDADPAETIPKTLDSPSSTVVLNHTLHQVNKDDDLFPGTKALDGRISTPPQRHTLPKISDPTTKTTVTEHIIHYPGTGSARPSMPDRHQKSRLEANRQATQELDSRILHTQGESIGQKVSQTSFPDIDRFPFPERVSSKTNLISSVLEKQESLEWPRREHRHKDHQQTAFKKSLQNLLKRSTASPGRNRSSPQKHRPKKHTWYDAETRTYMHTEEIE